ncbi:hypothetical protein, partial [Flavobacterium columnare]|uniref:hypothetical protein n=1 Tax=Flavobacterium columnare TaxID=996 RepID=UPI001E656125
PKYLLKPKIGKGIDVFCLHILNLFSWSNLQKIIFDVDLKFRRIFGGGITGNVFLEECTRRFALHVLPRNFF